MWTRQKVVLTLVNQPLHVGSFIDIVAVFLPNFAEGLNANGQSAFGHIMHLCLSIFTIICNLVEKTGVCNGILAYNAGVFGGVPDKIGIMSISFSA